MGRTSKLSRSLLEIFYSDLGEKKKNKNRRRQIKMPSVREQGVVVLTDKGGSVLEQKDMQT